MRTNSGCILVVLLRSVSAVVHWESSGKGFADGAITPSKGTGDGIVSVTPATNEAWLIAALGKDSDR
ncbi:hypothetical protein [Thiolapillus sp.]